MALSFARAAVAAAGVLAGTLGAAAAPAVADSRREQAVQLGVALGQEATLGGTAEVRVRLRISPRRPPAAVVRLAYPAGLGVTTSSLGLAECRRHPDDFAAVAIDLPGLSGCPPNAVLATGRLRGRGHFGDFETGELGRITLLSGPIRAGRLQLVALVDAERPIGTKLAYQGVLKEPSRRRYGGVLALRLPPIPSLPPGSTVALTRARITIGGPDIVYRDDDGRRWRPGGIALPATCPTRGLPFRTAVRFTDGTHAAALARAPCPRRRRTRR